MTDIGPQGARSPSSDAPGAEPVRLQEHGEQGEKITSLEGVPALSLDAISSVAYGPEAMLVVLATAGAGALAAIEPVTL
ncbi:MAG: amino acid permease, partial [Actinomycetota bacterium]|nr:amino acid permease [Actinomycetota bacterium]